MSTIDTFGNSHQIQVLNDDVNYNMTSTKVTCSEKPRIGTSYTDQQEFVCDPFFISTRDLRK